MQEGDEKVLIRETTLHRSRTAEGRGSLEAEARASALGDRKRTGPGRVGRARRRSGSQRTHGRPGHEWPCKATSQIAILDLQRGLLLLILVQTKKGYSKI